MNKKYNPEALKTELHQLQEAVTQFYAQLVISSRNRNQDIWLGIMKQKIKKRKDKRVPLK